MRRIKGDNMKRNVNKKPSNPAQEDKRYFLTEYVGHRIKVLNNEEELKEILESVRLFTFCFKSCIS